MKSRSPRASRSPMPVGLIAALAIMAAAAVGEDGAVAGSAGASAMPAAPAASSPTECSAMERVEGAEALLASMDREPARAVRVLLKSRPGPEAFAELRRALDAMNFRADPVGNGPWLVMEVDVAQLRTVLATCQVIGVQRDSPAPTD